MWPSYRCRKGVSHKIKNFAKVTQPGRIAPGDEWKFILLLSRDSTAIQPRLVFAPTYLPAGEGLGVTALSLISMVPSFDLFACCASSVFKPEILKMCGSWASNISITWELARDAYSQAY